MDDSRFALLTVAERQCLRALARAGENGSAAKLAGRSLGTFNTHMKSVRRKLRANTSIEAAAQFAAWEGHHPTWGTHDRMMPSDVQTPDPNRASAAGPLDLRNRNSDNDTGFFARLGWIALLALIIAAGALVAVSTVRGVNDLYRERVGR